LLAHHSITDAEAANAIDRVAARFGGGDGHDRDLAEFLGVIADRLKTKPVRSDDDEN
jgi:hypothetical protein